MLRTSLDARILSDELLEERKRRQEVIAWAEEGEQTSQKVLADLACERALRVQAHNRVLQLEAELGAVRQEIHAASAEFQHIRSESMAKDRLISDLEALVQTAQNKAHGAEATRLAEARQAKLEAEHSATVIEEAYQAKSDMSRERERERKHKAEACAERDTLEMRWVSCEQELESANHEMRALETALRKRDQCIQELSTAAERTASTYVQAERSSFQAGQEVGEWADRCKQVQKVLVEIEMAARADAESHRSQLQTVERREASLVTELRSSEANARTEAQTALSQSAAAREMSQTLGKVEADNASLQQAALTQSVAAREMSQTLGRVEAENANLQQQVARFQLELKSNFQLSEELRSESRTHSRDLFSSQREQQRLSRDLEASIAELSRAKQKLEVSEFEAACIEAEHLAALDRCANFEVEAKQRSAEAAEYQAKAQVREAVAALAKTPAQRVAKAHADVLASELLTERAVALEAAGTLEASMQALHDQERVTDDLRKELEEAAVSCAAARAARVAGKSRTAMPTPLSLKRSTRATSAGRAAAVRAAVEAAAGRAGTLEPSHASPLLQHSNAHRLSAVRLRIEEEARLRMSLGLPVSAS